MMLCGVILGKSSVDSFTRICYLVEGNHCLLIQEGAEDELEDVEGNIVEGVHFVGCVNVKKVTHTGQFLKVMTHQEALRKRAHKVVGMYTTKSCLIKEGVRLCLV